MYSYTNKKGESVKVSRSHLKTAVELKKLLQKDSPSNRCSWAKHRSLMIKEGYKDSENSENYRTMIKRYQKTIGELSPSPSEDVAESKTSQLDSYKELVGEMTYLKRENQKYLKEINKGKREIIDGTLFIREMNETVERVLNNVDWEKIVNRKFSPVSSYGSTRMLLLLTDWHLGALVDVEDNKFNYNIAVQRIEKMIQRTIDEGSRNSVSQVDVVFMGDMIEGHFMRSGQAYDVEFPTSEQMSRGGELLIQALNILSSSFKQVTFRAFAGNHDRINQSDKNGNITGDSSMVVVNKIVKTFVDASKPYIKNIKFVETHHSHAKMIDVNGINIKLVHGDKVKKKDEGKIHDHSSIDGIIYNLIVYGHFHHYLFLETGINKHEMRVGSLKGSDDYSEELGLGSRPSQALVLIDINGEITPKKIDLH